MRLGSANRRVFFGANPRFDQEVVVQESKPLGDAGPAWLRHKGIIHGFSRKTNSATNVQQSENPGLNQGAIKDAGEMKGSQRSSEGDECLTRKDGHRESYRVPL